MESTRSTPSPIGPLQGDHLARPGLDVALHAQEPGHREAPDVGVEDADGEAPAGQGHGQVHRDRGLAHPALARGHGQDPGGRGHRGRRRALPGLPPGPGHDGRLLAVVHLPDGQVDRRVTPGSPLHPAADVALDLGPQRAAGDGQGHLDGGRSRRRRRSTARTIPRSTMLSPELGIDHRREGLSDLVGGREGPAGCRRSVGAAAWRHPAPAAGRRGAGSHAPMLPGRGPDPAAPAPCGTGRRIPVGLTHGVSGGRPRRARAPGPARRQDRDDDGDLGQHRQEAGPGDSHGRRVGQGGRTAGPRGGRRPGPAGGREARGLLRLQLRDVLRLRDGRRRHRPGVRRREGRGGPGQRRAALGVDLDYSDGLQGAGFHITNPNATRTCGCGSSFS